MRLRRSKPDPTEDHVAAARQEKDGRVARGVAQVTIGTVAAGVAAEVLDATGVDLFDQPNVRMLSTGVIVAFVVWGWNKVEKLTGYTLPEWTGLDRRDGLALPVGSPRASSPDDVPPTETPWASRPGE